MAIPTRPRRTAPRRSGGGAEWTQSGDGWDSNEGAGDDAGWASDDRSPTRVAPARSARPPRARRETPRTSRQRTGRAPGGLRRIRLVDGEPGGRVRLGVPYQSVWLSYVIALALFLLLTSGDLVRTVRAMDIGPLRTVTLPVAQGIDRTANLFSLNRPADALGAAIGREVDDPSEPVNFEAATVPKEDTTPPLREVTAQVPLEVYVAGDSMGQPLGQLMEAAGVEDPTLDVSYEYKISSGLARPDYYNWPARFAQIAKDEKPEALVMMIGGNDAQELTDPAGNVVARPRTPEWSAEYGRRLDELFDGLRADNRRLFWVLQPDVASSKHQRSVDAMTAEATESAESRPWVTLVDAGELTAGADGGYADYLTLEDGSQISCRHGDGVHLTAGCTQLVSDAIVGVIADTWEIGETAAPAGTPLEVTDGRDSAGPNGTGATGAGETEAPSSAPPTTADGSADE